VARTDRVRLVREGRVIYTGDISSLKRHKDDVREVKEGFECGIKLANYEDIKEDDVIESFAIVEEKRIL
jgi:translation initiation factor IF-2